MTKRARTLSLSDDAWALGQALAGKRGIKVSQVVEQFLRMEADREGISIESLKAGERVHATIKPAAKKSGK